MISFVFISRMGERSVSYTHLLIKKHSEIQAAIEYIDLKQDFYDEVLSGKIEYFSNLVGEE